MSRERPSSASSAASSASSPVAASDSGPLRSHRPATIDLSPSTFRRVDVSLEAAQRSLTDALRITFGVVWAVLIALIALFLASGFQQVGESERGVTLRFGKVVRENVGPGYTWAWPYPIGEVVRVDVGQRSLDLEEDFWPNLTKGQKQQALQELAGRKRQLVPGKDHANLVAGGALAHTQWRMLYSVSDPARYARAIAAGQEEAIVRALLDQAVVESLAGVTVDELLGQAPGALARLERRVRLRVQELLDRMNAGMQVDQVILRRRTPPLFVLESFNNVTTASAKAAQEREQALRDAQQTLTSVAGQAASALLKLIDDYEQALDAADASRADDALATIDRLLNGEAVAIDGQTVVVSGEVAEIISEARRYRTDVVAQARRRAAAFEAKLPLYRENPRVFTASEWSRAYKAFRDQGVDEAFYLPGNASDVQILLNSDPEIAKRLEEARNTAEAKKAREKAIERQAEEFRRKRREQQSSSSGGGG